MVTPDLPRPGGAALRLYQGYRYIIVTFINGAGKPPTAQAELWWQPETDMPLAKWTYFRRQVAVTAAMRGMLFAARAFYGCQRAMGIVDLDGTNYEIALVVSGTVTNTQRALGTRLFAPLPTITVTLRDLPI